MGRDLHKRKVPFMEINEKDSAEMRYGQIWYEESSSSCEFWGV